MKHNRWCVRASYSNIKWTRTAVVVGRILLTGSIPKRAEQSCLGCCIANKPSTGYRTRYQHPLHDLHRSPRSASFVASASNISVESSAANGDPHFLPVLVCLPDEYPNNPHPTSSQLPRLGFSTPPVGEPSSPLDFQDLVSFWKAQVCAIAQHLPRDQPLYLVGEGTGALVAICIAAECRKEVNRLVLINTPTAFPSSALRNFLLLPPAPFSLPRSLPLPWQVFPPSTPAPPSPRPTVSPSPLKPATSSELNAASSTSRASNPPSPQGPTSLPASPERAAIAANQKGLSSTSVHDTQSHAALSTPSTPRPSTTVPVNKLPSTARTSPPSTNGTSAGAGGTALPNLSVPLPALLPSLPLPPFPFALPLPPALAAAVPQVPTADVQGAAQQLQALLSASVEERARYLKLLDDGVAAAGRLLSRVSQRTLLLAGGKDALLDSAKEAEKLVNSLTRCQTLVLRDYGLSILSSPAFDLREQLCTAGFYTSQLHFTSAGEPADPGRPGPIELPTSWDLSWVDRSRGGLDTLVRRVCSPVYITTKEGGERVVGLGHLPADRPLLIVGNHQLMAPDTAQVIQQVLEQKGLLLRGLAHPALLLNPKEAKEKLGALGQVLPGRTADVFQSYGAVPVGPSSLYKLLAAGESVLLYPGGEREIYKRQNEKYKLFWPARAEFVRTAAKFGATIIPLAAVGVEECVNVVLDSQQLVSAPVLGPLIQRATGAAPKARLGPTDVLEFDQLFVPPLVSVSVPTRMYFLFQEPIHLQPDMYRDKARCQEVYEQVRTSVQNGIDWLRHKQQQDPYKDFVARLVYENPLGREARQAPTFKL